DPAGVKALLEQLRASQAWQETLTTQRQSSVSSGASAHTRDPGLRTDVDSTITSVSDAEVHTAISTPNSDGLLPVVTQSLDEHPSHGAGVPPRPAPGGLSSVASLLSQLQGSSSVAAVAGSAPPIETPVVQASAASSSSYRPPEHVPTHRPTTRPHSAHPRDLRSCTFQQALPHLARLSEDPRFVAAISAMKTEQADLERQLWDERQAIERKHEEKVTVARTKANMIGSGLTQYEADALSRSFLQELRKFDLERVLPAWDGLVTKQQAALESLGVPAMFPTTVSTDRDVRTPCVRSMCVIHPERTETAADRTVALDLAIPMGLAVWRLAARRSHLPAYARNFALLCRPSGYPIRSLQILTSGSSAPVGMRACMAMQTLDVLVLLSSYMPYVDLYTSDDYASIWYTTNTPNGNVGSFDPSKPTIVMLHPLCLDSTWLHPQLDDPRLDSGFNIIAFDTRSTGRSYFRPSGKYDLWVNMADLAQAFHLLHLPPAHIFACELYAYTALRLAILFPELCLSLTLCNLPTQTELRSVFDAFEELAQMWAYAQDLESFEYCCKDLLELCTGTDAHPDLQDELVAYWEVWYPPFRRTYTITNVNLAMNRTPLTPQELACITCPILIIQAERSRTHPLSYAEEVVQQLINVPGGAVLFPVKGATSHAYLSILSASIVNQVFYKFLSRQPPTRSDLTPPPMSLERMRAALHTLAELKDDWSIANRDPKSSMSFTCVTDEVRKSQDDTFKTYCKDERKAFSPLGPDGRPVRKFSERKSDWLGVSKDGYSYFDAERYQGKHFARSKKQSKKAAAELVSGEQNANALLTPSEPVSAELQQLGRIRRATISPGAMDQNVIKGSMAKVVAPGGGIAGVSLPRLLQR
ncbi:alpha/beta-hydrolase, partial [Obba rivulosa]